MPKPCSRPSRLHAPATHLRVPYADDQPAVDQVVPRCPVRRQQLVDFDQRGLDGGGGGGVGQRREAAHPALEEHDLRRPCATA